MCPTTRTLVVRVGTPLPCGGHHTACLDFWTGHDTSKADTPLWLTFLSEASADPTHFTQTLGWLHGVISVIEARPGRRQCDVWWRFLRFLNNVKVASHYNVFRWYKVSTFALQEAYRRAPSPPQVPRPRPRPRPLRRSRPWSPETDGNEVVDAMVALELAGDAEKPSE